MAVSDSVCLYGRILRQRQQQEVCKTFPGQVCRRRVLDDEGDLPICRRGAADHHLCEELTSFAACQQVFQLAGIYEQLHPLRARNGTRRDNRHLAYRHFTIIMWFTGRSITYLLFSQNGFVVGDARGRGASERADLAAEGFRQLAPQLLEPGRGDGRRREVLQQQARSALWRCTAGAERLLVAPVQQVHTAHYH